MSDEPTRTRAGGMEPEELERLLTAHLAANLTPAEIVRVRALLAEDDFVSKQEKKRSEALAAKRERNNAVRAWIATWIAVCTLLLTTVGPRIWAFVTSSPSVK